MNERFKALMNRDSVHADDASDRSIQTTCLREVVCQLMEIEPRLLRQDQRTKVFEVVLTDRLPSLDLLQRLTLVNDPLQRLIDSVAVGDHIQAIELVELYLVPLAFDLRFILLDVDDLRLDRDRGIELAKLNDSPKFIS